MQNWVARIRRSLATGKLAAAVTHVLIKTYSFQIDPSEKKYLMIMCSNMDNVLNKHGIAVLYLADFSEKIDTENPKAKTTVESWIKFAKGARNRRLYDTDFPLDRLIEVAQRRFNLDANQISAF